MRALVILLAAATCSCVSAGDHLASSTDPWSGLCRKGVRVTTGFRWPSSTTLPDRANFARMFGALPDSMQGPNGLERFTRSWLGSYEAASQSTVRNALASLVIRVDESSDGALPLLAAATLSQTDAGMDQLASVLSFVWTDSVANEARALATTSTVAAALSNSTRSLTAYGIAGMTRAHCGMVALAAKRDSVQDAGNASLPSDSIQRAYAHARILRLLLEGRRGSDTTALLAGLVASGTTGYYRLLRDELSFLRSAPQRFRD